MTQEQFLAEMLRLEFDETETDSNPANSRHYYIGYRQGLARQRHGNKNLDGERDGVFFGWEVRGFPEGEHRERMGRVVNGEICADNFEEHEITRGYLDGLNYVAPEVLDDKALENIRNHRLVIEWKQKSDKRLEVQEKKQQDTDARAHKEWAKSKLA